MLSENFRQRRGLPSRPARRLRTNATRRLNTERVARMTLMMAAKFEETTIAQPRATAEPTTRTKDNA